MSPAPAGGASSPAPTPLPLPPAPADSPMQLSDAQRQEVADTIAALDSQFDLTLVEWAAPTPLPDRPSLLLYGWAGGTTPAAATAEIGATAQTLGSDLEGVIINEVLRHRRRQVEQEVVAPLRAQGIPVWGAIPEDREMLALTLGQLADYLEGRWVEEPPDPDAWVDRFLIGGNIMDSGPNYFGRYPHQAVIARAGRPDIQLASLMSATKCVVLTGGEAPTEYVRVEARKRAAALLLVEADTLTTAESLGGLLQRANPYSRHKQARFAALMERHLSIKNYELGITNESR